MSHYQMYNDDVTAQTDVNIAVGEFLFSEAVHLTGITEYGVRWDELTGGAVAPPAEGARFDLSFAGTLVGPRIEGKISGIDYLEVRADGRFMLNIQATVTTTDGENIALHEDGILVPPANPDSPAILRLNLKFTTASPKYSWLNKLHVWAQGEVNMNLGEVTVKVYAA